jgi:ribosomal protein S18 acetylase RimI-like enzyme
MASIEVSEVKSLEGSDLHELCEAVESAIGSGGGFGWLTPPPRQTLEVFWRGVLLVPERTVFIGKLDNVVAGSASLLRPVRNNEAQAKTISLSTNFVAPWARGHGLARALTRAAEDKAREDGFDTLNLDVRETQEAAIALYESNGYTRWGAHPRYAHNGDKWVQGFYYFKDLSA